MNRVVFNYGLLLEDRVANEVTRFSQDLCRPQNSLYTLGAKSLPHITILQFEEDASQASSIWSRLQDLTPDDDLVDLRGIVIDRWRDWDVVWIKVVKHYWLARLQEKAAAIMSEYDFVNALGERFEPHLTVGAWPSKDRFDSIAIPPSLMNRSGVQARLGLGVSGPNFQYERELFWKEPNSR